LDFLFGQNHSYEIQQAPNAWQIGQVSLGHTIVNVPFQVIFEEYVEANKPGTYKKLLVFFNLIFGFNYKFIKKRKSI
jgi:hypothetical protein